MGLLDDLFKAVESGALEERLSGIADKVEKVSDVVTEKVEKIADTSEKIVKSEQDEQTTS